MATQPQASSKEAVVETRDADEFASLLKQSFKPRSERAATEVENAVSTLVKQALSDTSLIKGQVLDTIEEMIAQLDKKLTVQINEILHNEEFQAIESAWRGLSYLVHNSETDATLKTKVIEGGVIGEDGEPVLPGTYVAPSAELGDREFEVVAGETFYVIIHTVAVNSNVPGFEVGDENTLMLTFDAVLGNANQFVVAWLETPAGFVPFLNEGVMKTVLHER